MTFVELISKALTYLTLSGQGIIALLVAANFFSKKDKDKFFKMVSQKSILFSFIIAITAMLGSLFYSEIAHYEPCKLCWFQRIFMYPLPFIFGVSLWKKDRNVIRYGLVLSAIGGLIALYHYLLQLGVVPNGACNVVGYSISCSQRFVMEMGYITIPMMSLTAFALITIFLLIGNGKTTKK